MFHKTPAVEELHIPIYCPKCVHETDLHLTLLWDRKKNNRLQHKRCGHCKHRSDIDLWLHRRTSPHRTAQTFLHGTQWYDVAKKLALLTRQLSEDNTSITKPTQHVSTPTSKRPRAQTSARTQSDVQTPVRKRQRVQALVQQHTSIQTASDVQLPARISQRVPRQSKASLKVFGPVRTSHHK